LKQNCSILHVEDDANDVYFVARALRGSGIELPVEVVNDGQSAIDFLDKAGNQDNGPGVPKPCLVILDLNLPHKSGLEVLKWIREDSRWKTIIVMVLTSSTSDADMHQAYSLGANAYVLKPSDATKLRELGQLLKQFWLGWNQMPPLMR
jgi:CheY-like chemotaxis protein